MSPSSKRKIHNLLKPASLKPGACIGVPTPSMPGNVLVKSKFLKGLSFLEKQGFKIKLGELTASFSSQGYRNGSASDRAKEFNDLYRDSEVSAIIFSIGGSNSASILPYIDYDYIRKHPKIISGYSDITSLHWYKAERGVNLDRFDEFNRAHFNKGTHALWADKPTYFQEMGADHVINDPYDAGDMDNCSDISYHNALWATSFMGGFGTGFQWWSWANNSYREQNYPALNAFFNDIDFHAFKFKDPDFWDDALVQSNSTIETFYIRDEHARRVMGWVHNTTYWWGNIIQNCPDRNNNSIEPPDDDDTPSSPQALPLATTFEVHGLNNLQNYNLEWFETRNNGGGYFKLRFGKLIFLGLCSLFTKGQIHFIMLRIGLLKLIVRSIISEPITKSQRIHCLAGKTQL